MVMVRRLVVGGGGGASAAAAASSSSILLLLLLLLAAAAAAGQMELYFSPAELARVAGYGEELVSTVVVSGEVACELCLRPGADLLSFELPGSKVAVTCKPPSAAAYTAVATTDEYGRFAVELPSRLHAAPGLESVCSVQVLQLRPEHDSACLRGAAAPAASSHGLIRLSSSSSSEDGDGGGVRTYTTGVIRLRHGGTPSGECAQEEEGRRTGGRRMKRM